MEQQSYGNRNRSTGLSGGAGQTRIKPPTPDFKRATLRYLIKKHGLSYFVESGTYLGDTTAAISPLVRRADTIELAVDLHVAALERFRDAGNVTCWRGDSGELLGQVLSAIDAPVLLWLDGHHSGGITAKGTQTTPIWRELQQVAESEHAAAHVVLIDDARLFDGTDYPPLPEILAWARGNFPGHLVRVHNDMIFMEPARESATMTPGLRQLALRYEPRKPFCQDSGYWLAPGPNFDRDAAWSAGFEDSDCISALCAVRHLRLGNAVRQVTNAIGTALANGFRSVYLPGYWWLKPGAFATERGLRIVNLPGRIFDDEEMVLAGDFFDISALRGVTAPSGTAYEIVHDLAGWIVPNRVVPSLEEDHLVIHLRAGDVFAHGKVHSKYGQPPLAFYQAVLASTSWNGVTLVAEDARNPVVDPLSAYCRAVAPTTVRIGGSLQDDLAFLLRASTLVVARGSFGRALSALSLNLRSVHMFESEFDHAGNPAVVTTRWVDVPGEYRRTILANNWTNSPSQRELMLRYAVSNLSKAPHGT